MNRQLPDCHWNLPEIEEAKFNANPGLFLSANQQPVSRLQRPKLPLGIRTIEPHPSKGHGNLRLFYARKFGNTHTSLLHEDDNHEVVETFLNVFARLGKTRAVILAKRIVIIFRGPEIIL